MEHQLTSPGFESCGKVAGFRRHLVMRDEGEEARWMEGQMARSREKVLRMV